MMNKLKIICGFPGIGKTFFTTMAQRTNLNVWDSDSSSYSWLEAAEGKIRNPEFPNNYMYHIKSLLDNQTIDYILVSTHTVVREALQKNGIEYLLVYPDKSLKQEYLERFYHRGSDINFIKFLDKNWDSFIKEMEDDPSTKRILSHDQYLTDVIPSPEAMTG